MTDPVADSLDPEDWPAFRRRAHGLLDAALDQMQGAREGRVWTPVPDATRAALAAPLPRSAIPAAELDAALAALMPYGVGNTHPRFFGWVHGAGTPAQILPAMIEAAMNANCGGRDHVGLTVERQVIAWMAELFGFGPQASGLVVSGTSMATLIALKAARDWALDGGSRTGGVPQGRLVGYTSSEAHGCVTRAFDMLGLGTDSLRRIPVNSAFEMDMAALTRVLEGDLTAGLQPFCVIATVGTVNTGASDPLADIARLAKDRKLWLHVDGAFGACSQMAPSLAGRMTGIALADSLAFDFHKWMHVNYDAGCVLVRQQARLLDAFSTRPDYLAPETRGLAAGAPWPVDLGPELSRGFRALKVWAQLTEFGLDRIGALVEQNCALAQYLARQIDNAPGLERLAPVPLQIVCFRAVRDGLDEAGLDRLNREIVIALQESGLAAPSTTRINGKLAIRVNLTNHRTREGDIDLLLGSVLALAQQIAS